MSWNASAKIHLFVVSFFNQILQQLERGALPLTPLILLSRLFTLCRQFLPYRPFVRSPSRPSVPFVPSVPSVPSVPIVPPVPSLPSAPSVRPVASRLLRPPYAFRPSAPCVPSCSHRRSRPSRPLRPPVVSVPFRTVPFIPSAKYCPPRTSYPSCPF